MDVILRYFSEFGSLPGALRKSSRSLSHLLMRSCRIMPRVFAYQSAFGYSDGILPVFQLEFSNTDIMGRRPNVIFTATQSWELWQCNVRSSKDWAVYWCGKLNCILQNKCTIHGLCIGYNIVCSLLCECAIINCRPCCNLFISWPLTRWRLTPKHIIVQTTSSNPWN